MRPLLALAFVVSLLILGVAASACSDDDVGSDYYDNEIHNGYPGPGVKTPENRGGG